MLKPISRLPALVLTAFALLIAGCGGGGDDSTPTKAEFIKQAEAICRKAHSAEALLRGEYIQKNYEQIKRDPPPPNDNATLVIVKTIRVPAVFKEIEELKVLEPPDGDGEKLQKIFDGTEEGARELNENPKLVWANRAGNPLYPSYKIAREYGFELCAES